MSGASAKRDGLYQLGNGYEKRVLNLKRLLKELIETSNQPLTLPINWDEVMVLHLPSLSSFSEDPFRLRLFLSCRSLGVGLCEAELI